MLKTIWSQYRFHLLAVAIMLLACVIYFYPQLEGKVLVQGDLVSSKAKGAEIAPYLTKDKDFFLWTNSQFGGMPRMIGAPAKNNILRPLLKVTRFGFDRPIGLFLSIALFAYILFVFLKIPPIAAAFFGLAISLNTNNVILWDAGHASKIATLAFTPIILAGMWLVFERRKYMLGGALFALGFGFSIYTRHPQMTYYLFLALAIYGVIKLYYIIRDKDWGHLMKGVGIVLLAIILGLGASASRVGSMYEYNKSSMRGAPVLKQDKAQSSGNSSSEVEGLAWNYAMQWSNGGIDLLSSFVPAAAGGGSAYEVPKSNPFYKKYRMERAPMYWGDLPFTEGPIYLGIVFLLLFVFGLIYYQGPIKWWLASAVLMTFLLSMGKHFEVLNRFIFDYFPLYSKFRTPQSILSVTVFILPILGIISLEKLMRRKDKELNKKKYQPEPNAVKALYWSLGIVGGGLILLYLLGGSMFSFEGVNDQRYLQQGVSEAVFYDARLALFRSDLLRSLLFVALSGGLLWAYIKNKIKAKPIVIIGIALLSFVDIWGVSKRFLGHDDFVSKRKLQQQAAPRPVDQQIKQLEPNRYEYRVFDLSINTFNSAFTSNFHNHIGGYHPAKLQRYQDMIDRYIGNGNQGVLNMLNTKYIITQDQKVQRNPNALGNAWAVDEIVKASTPNEEINKVGQINPAQTAVVLDEEFDGYIGGFDPVKDPNMTIKLVDYNPEKLTYQYNASAEQFVLFSEIWYGPDLGWQAYIDGEPVEHIRANYVLRAMRVPAGQHEIVFEFRPKVYYAGETVNLISSALIILLLIVALYFEWKNTNIKSAEMEPV